MLTAFSKSQGLSRRRLLSGLGLLGTTPLLPFSAALGQTTWRDLARNGVPFDQWPIDAKLAAVQDYTAAVARNNPTEDDWELFKLQQPYVSQFQQFVTTITITTLTPLPPAPNVASATMTGLLQYEAPVGARTGWTAVVNLPTSAAPAGEAVFELFGGLGQVDLKRVPLNAGAATYTTVPLPKGRYFLRVRYEPLDTGNSPSAQMVILTVL
jgi:hypothetical protein